MLEDIIFWLRMRPRLFGEIERVKVPMKEELIRKYREGLAMAIGVKPEDIREDILEKWLVNWLRSIIKPEVWEKYGLA